MSNRQPLVNNAGRISELPDPDDFTFGGGLVKASVDVSKTRSVPSGYSLVVSKVFTVNGTLTNNGNMTVI